MYNIPDTTLLWYWQDLVRPYVKSEADLHVPVDGPAHVRRLLASARERTSGRCRWTTSRTPPGASRTGTCMARRELQPERGSNVAGPFTNGWGNPEPPPGRLSRIRPGRSPSSTRARATARSGCTARRMLTSTPSASAPMSGAVLLPLPTRSGCQWGHVAKRHNGGLRCGVHRRPREVDQELPCRTIGVPGPTSAAWRSQFAKRRLPGRPTGQPPLSTAAGSGSSMTRVLASRKPRLRRSWPGECSWSVPPEPSITTTRACRPGTLPTLLPRRHASSRLPRRTTRTASGPSRNTWRSTRATGRLATTGASLLPGPRLCSRPGRTGRAGAGRSA